MRNGVNKRNAWHTDALVFIGMKLAALDTFPDDTKDFLRGGAGA